MADYGYYGKKSKRRKERHERGSENVYSGDSTHTVIMRIIDIVVAVITIIMAAVFLIAFSAQWVNPEKMSYVAVVGLFYPFIYVANLACMLYWAFRWSKMFWLSFLMVFIGLSSIKMFYRPKLTKQYKTETEQSSEYDEQEGFVVMTYNIMGFQGVRPEDKKDCIEKISSLANEKSAAIICFQEFYKNASSTSKLDSALDNMRYSVFVNYEEKTPNADGLGLAIYSVYPIVNSGTVDMGVSRMHSLWADVKIDRDTIRVISNHLQNTHITKEDRNETITTKIIGDTAAKEKVMVLAKKLADNYKLRSDQARILHEFIISSPYDVIVCGDFNDTAASYVYNKVGKGLTDTFTECGSGFVHTFNELGRILRIDFIMVSDGFEVKDYEVVDTLLSDHLPVFSRVMLSSGKSDD